MKILILPLLLLLTFLMPMAVNAQQDNRSNNEVSCDPISVSPWAETWSIEKWPYYNTQPGNYNLFSDYDNCWFAPDTIIASDGSYSPRLWYNGENHDRHLSFKERNGSEQIKQVVVFPEFQCPIKSLTVSFECCLSAADNNRNVEIGYYDMSTGVYEEISYVYVNTTSFGQFEVVVGDSQYCPQTYDANHRLAIALHDRGNGISCDVRNISVSFPDLCSTPTELNASDILKTATLSWTGLADSYNLMFAIAGHPFASIENVTSPYTITDLEPDTRYQYKVQAVNCDGHGGTSDWSEIAEFATPSSCLFKPEALTVTEISYQSATMGWTGYTDTYNLHYRKVDTEDWTTVSGINNPYTLTGLDHGTQYEFQVQGVNCDSYDGTTDWSDEMATFTTLSPETLTLYDGLEDSNIIPISSSMIDKNPKNQFIIPAVQLEDMEGGSITGLSWYYGQSPHFTPLVDDPVSTTEVGMPAILSLTEVDYTEVTGFVDDSMLDTVYDADAVFVAGAQELTLVFSQPYEYHGGNLLINFAEKIPYSVDGILINSTFVGQYQYYDCAYNNQDYYSYDPNDPGAYQPTRERFLPKTTFFYIPGETEKPKHLAIDNLSSTTATLSWVSDANNHKIVVTTSEGSNTINDVTSNPYTLENLTPGTTYTVQVVACCTGGDVYSLPLTFNTDFCPDEDQCNLTFEMTDSHSNCWNGSAIKVVDVETGMELGKMANTNHGSSTDTKTLAVCEGREISFQWHGWRYDGETSYVIKDVNGEVICSGNAGNGLIDSYVMTCRESSYPRPTNLVVSNISGYEADFSWTENGGAGGWALAYKRKSDPDENYYVFYPLDHPYFTLTHPYLQPETEYIVKVCAMHGMDENLWSNWSNTVTFTTKVSCPAPELAVPEGHDINSRSIALHWNGYSNYYEIQYRLGSTGEWTIAEDDYEGESYVLDGLTPETTYEIQVQGFCAIYGQPGEEESEVSTVTVTTLASTLAWQAIPYNYGFGDNDLSHDGWSTLNVTNALTGITTATHSTYMDQDDRSFAFCYAEDQGACLVSPILDGTEYGLAMEYRARCHDISNSSYCEYFQIGYTTDEKTPEQSSFTFFDETISVCNQNWLQDAFSCELPAGTKRVAIKYIPNPDFAGFLYFDDFSFFMPCPLPLGLEVNDIMPRSVTVSWDRMATDESDVNYQYLLVEQGETPNWDNAIAYVDEVSNSNAPSVSLVPEPHTTYDFLLRRDCGDGDYSTAASISFTTPFEVTSTVSFTEGFEDTAFPPQYWQRTPHSNTAGEMWVRSGDHHHSGNGSAYGPRSDRYTLTHLYTPEIYLSEDGDAQLSFWSFNTKKYYQQDISAKKSAVHVIIIGGPDIFLWRPDTPVPADQWVKTTIDLSAYKGKTIRIDFRYVYETTYYWYVDDVEIAMKMDLQKEIGAYTESGGYHLIASPLAAAVTPTADNGFLTNDYDLYYFDQVGDSVGNEWINYKSGNFNLTNGKGYLYANSDGTTLHFNGLPYTGNGEVSLAKDDNATLAGWNLIGNPYAATAYLSDDRSFYKMNPAGEELVSSTGAVEAMEGVFVIAGEDNETVSFTTTQPESGSKGLTLNLSQGRGLVDRAIVRFDEGSELPKFQLRKGNTKVYIPQDDNEYAVVRSEGVGELPVCFKAEKNGSYTLSFSSEEVELSYLHLIDNMTGIDVDLLANPSYSFEARTTDYESRFRLVFASGAIDDDDFAFFSNGQWFISNEDEATLQVIDMMGRVLSSETIKGSCSKSIKAAPGVYVLQIVSNSRTKTQKIVLD